MRDIETIRAEFVAADMARQLAITRHIELKIELELALASATQHEWLGRKVKRQAARGYRRTPVTRRGTLMVYNPQVKLGYRELYRAMAGDLIVVSPSGQTAWDFDLPSCTPGTPWELDE